MSTTATAQLESELIDLSAVPLAELAHLSIPEVTDAVRATIVAAAASSGDERQEQRD